MTATVERSQPDRARAVGRVPPHSREAEESVLGALFLSPHAANEVMDKLVPGDFYVPAHQAIFEAMLTLYNSNQPLDVVTVSEELRRGGELEKVGGLTYLAHLVDVVPAASNIGYYSEIVAEHGLRRSLIKAGSSITDLAFRTDDEVRMVLDRAEQEVLGVAEKRAGEGMLPVGPLFQSAIEHIEALEANGSEITGLSTGFRDLDRKLAGLQKANLVVIAARPSMGKCLAGGSLVLDPVTGQRHSIESLFNDPSLLNSLHTLSLADNGKLVSTRPSAIADNGYRPVYRLRTRLGHEIEATANHPFLTINGWRELADLQRGDQVAVGREYSVDGGEVLVGASAAAERPPTHERRLSRGLMAELAMAIGSESLSDLASSDVVWDAITSIEPLGEKRTFDLEVPGYQNFVANDFVVHNSALTLNMATHIARSGRVVALFSLEMAKEEVVQRILCSVGKVESTKLRTGQIGNQWDRLVSAANQMFKTPIFVDDSSVVTVTDIRAKSRRLKRVHGLDLVVVDYLQLMQGSSKENRQQEIAEISRGLKNLARELDVPIIAVSQLNRSVEQREDRRPRLSDLRESGALEQDSDVVMFIYRHEYYHPDDVEKKGTAEIIIAKHRSGATGTVEMTFMPDFTRFADLGRDLA
ncbi:MAG TPA: replicative DNA helicase [Acidimicrobiia bacterium]|nr:replicative DNA helicase [Acidimicrobiia bacterium]